MLASQTKDFEAALAQYGGAIDAEIRRELATDLDPFLKNTISYHLGWCDQDFRPLENGNSGKKLRSVMTLLAYQAAHPKGLQASLDVALPIAASLEMIHNYSLIHDDIEDDDQTRRGRKTIWAIWGKPKAINIGDCLNTLAFRCLSRMFERGLAADRALMVLQSVAGMSVKLSEGQHQDMTFEDMIEVSPEMYVQMISGKSAAIFACALECGALAGLPDPLDLKRAASFAEFGLKIGLGFQIRDDILGIWGESEKTGKSTSSDIRRRKKSLPVLYCLSQADSTYHDQLIDIYSRTEPVTPDEEAVVLQALNDCGAREYSQTEAYRYQAEAFEAIEAGPDDAANEALKQIKRLCQFLVYRHF